MRRGVLYILMSFILSGCTFDDVKDYNPDLDLMFQPEMYMHMSHNEIQSFPTYQSIGVKAWVLPSGVTWASSSATAEEFIPITQANSNEVFITDTTLRETVKDTLWSFDEQILWPTIFENLTFMAFSPYSDKCDCSVDEGVTFSINTQKEQVDMLYTMPNADKHKINNGWVVPIMFEHALCRVDFRVKHRVLDTETIILKSISIDNLCHKGRFASLSTPQWQLDKEQAELNFFSGAQEIGKQPEAIDNYMMVIPQSLDTFVTVEYQYTTASGTTITQKLKTVPLRTDLEAGNSYTYTLSIGIDDVKFLEEIVID